MLADEFYRGRVILAGDSTHAMSPTGGMGMNTGMQEVLDLGWKLEGLLKGWGGPKLLRSYETERRPIAQRNIGFSTQNFKAWLDTPNTAAVCDDTEEGERIRKALGQRLRNARRSLNGDVVHCARPFRALLQSAVDLGADGLCRPAAEYFRRTRPVAAGPGTNA